MKTRGRTSYTHIKCLSKRGWGTQWHESTKWGQVNQPRETANSRGQKSVTGWNVGLQFHKWWGPALNHFRFVIIFITLILVAPSRVHASNPRFKYDKIQRYCRNGPWMCYIIYYETKYAKNEEDFLPTSILEIWETLVAPSRFVSVENAWIISSGICKAGKAIMMTRAWAKCCCNVHGSILPEMWENQRFWLWWDCGQ